MTTINNTGINLPEIKMKLSFDKKIKKSELISIRSSYDAYQVFKNIFNADTFDWVEECIILCLNRANKVVGFYKVSSGGTTGAIVDPKVVFTIALNCAASGIILAHNHPSGNLTPSVADKEITKKIKEAGKLLDINLLDHLILTDESFYSFQDENQF
jgi:DNA repair protein RadC